MPINAIIAQVFGVGAIILSVIMPQMRTRERMILLSLCEKFLLIAQFTLLGAMAGVSAFAVLSLRSLILFFYARKDKRAPLFMLFALMAIHAIAVALAWEGWMSVFMFAPLANTYGQWQERPQVTRGMTIITGLGIGTYSLIAGAYTGAINEVIIISSAILALWRYKKLNFGKTLTIVLTN